MERALVYVHETTVLLAPWVLFWFPRPSGQSVRCKRRPFKKVPQKHGLESKSRDMDLQSQGVNCRLWVGDCFRPMRPLRPVTQRNLLSAGHELREVDEPILGTSLHLQYRSALTPAQFLLNLIPCRGTSSKF